MMGNVINSLIFTPRKPHVKTIEYFKHQYINTGGRYNIPYMVFENSVNDVVIIYSYGNCESIIDVSSFCKSLSKTTGSTVITYEYPGYGINYKKIPLPSEKLIKQSILDVTDFVNNKYVGRKIIHYGRSIGSGPAVYACSQRPDIVRGLIIESGFISIFKTILHVSVNIWGDAFKNGDIIDKINVPTLIIHGENDKIVPFYHAEELAKKSINLWGTLFLAGGGHNNLESNVYRRDLLFKLSCFIHFVATR